MKIHNVLGRKLVNAKPTIKIAVLDRIEKRDSAEVAPEVNFNLHHS